MSGKTTSADFWAPVFRTEKRGMSIADLLAAANAPRDWWLAHGLPIPPPPLNMATLTPGNIPGQIANTAIDAVRGAVNTAVDMGHMSEWSPMQLGMMMATTGAPQGIRAYHGSPYDFEKFDASKIGTGEGAQAYGHGLYFAENRGVAEGYRANLAKPTFATNDANLNRMLDEAHAEVSRQSRGPVSVTDAIDVVGQRLDRQRADALKAGDMEWFDSVANMRSELDQLRRNAPDIPGRTYEVSINANPDEFLDWDKPLSAQPQKVQEAVAPVLDQIRQQYGTKAANDPLRMSGEALYRWIGESPEAAANLQAAGIKGIRYLDQGSRASGAGTHNYVVFDPAMIEILKKYGIAGLTAGGLGAAAVAGGNPRQAKAAQ